MRRWIAGLLGIALVALAATACGGGGDKTIDTGNGQVTVGDDLPDSFPDDFPIYDGADLQGAVQGEQEGIEGIVATWTTGDDLDDVTAFYKQEFTDGPWKSQTDGTVGGSSFWSVENASSGKVGYVAVSGGDQVSIIATVGDNPDQASSGGDGSDGTDGSSDGSDGTGDGSDGADSGSGDGSATLPDEVDLPDDFPTDVVPLPDDARVTTANTVNASGTTYMTIGFYTRESADAVVEFYKAALEGKGYTETIQTSDASGAYGSYSENSDGTGRLIVVSATEGDVEGYRQVVLQISSGA